VEALIKPRVYLETTIFNYYFDKDREGHVETVKMFEAIGQQKFQGFTSAYVVRELLNASEPKKTYMISLIDVYGIKTLSANDEALRLANIYIANGVIPAKYRFDALHIASATLNNINYLLSFNFSHINKDRTKTMSSQINLREGYSIVRICTPKEVFSYD
jgi:predicted nucleic acid-binding protein